MLSTQRYTVTALLLVTPSCVLRKRPARLFLDQLTGTPLLTFPLFRSASCLYFREEMQLLASTCDISSIDERHSARVLLDLRSAPPQNRTRTTFNIRLFLFLGACGLVSRRSSSPPRVPHVDVRRVEPLYTDTALVLGLAGSLMDINEEQPLKTFAPRHAKLKMKLWQAQLD